MTKTSRIVVVAAALILSLTYFLPLWQISLDAPQYPEGLGMYIWINKMTGQEKHDLDKINNLNHYIGMKEIKPESIPELKYMPWIMRGLLVFGLIAGLVGNKKLLLIWIILFLLLSLAGLVDYYLWGYDYGHNLDQENAIIKIPGMSYQPPLIGQKKILNFTATSLPAAGGWVAILSLLSGVFVYMKERRRKSK